MAQRPSCTMVSHSATTLCGARAGVGWDGQYRKSPARGINLQVRIVGLPGALLLYLFGRQGVAQVELIGPADAVEAVGRTRHITQTKRAGPWQLLRICQPRRPGSKRWWARRFG